MKVYVAGPIRGVKDGNKQAFEKATKELREIGLKVFNPHEHGKEDIRDALATDLEWICRNADAVCLLHGWWKSTGAEAERATAVALGIEVFYPYPEGVTRSRNVHGVTIHTWSIGR